MSDSLHQLHQCFLCSGLNKNELEAVHKIALIRRFKKGEILFLEGDTAGGFYVLLSGRVRIYKSSSEGREYTIHQIAQGQLFAEAAIFRGEHYPASSVASADSTVAYFSKDAFMALIREWPQISLKIIASQAGFLRDFNRQVEELTLMEVPARIASFLLRESQKNKKAEIILDISKSELARRLGTVSETLSRNLKKLKDTGIIRVSGRVITILDLSRLFSLAEGEKI
jgi:CRP-like cAMP-binding protein